jgi:hypothetical protein
MMTSMKCFPCQNLAVQEIFVDYGSGIGAMSFLGYRCLICGDVNDATIMQHRASRCSALCSKSRRRGQPRILHGSRT